MAKGAVAFIDMGCVVSIPPGPRPKEGWPILIFLHGNGEAAPPLQVAMTRHGPLGASSGSEATPRFVVIAPQLPKPGGNVWNRFADQVEAIAQSAPEKYQGNRRQIYLTGFSYGGNGVLDIGALRPEVWAALWPVDPNRYQPVDSNNRPVDINRANQPIWVSAGESARRHHASFTANWRTVDHDWTANPYPHPNPRRVYEDRGLNHVPTAMAAYSAGAIYEWLLRHP
jgi:predicted peptidase